MGGAGGVRSRVARDAGSVFEIVALGAADDDAVAAAAERRTRSSAICSRRRNVALMSLSMRGALGNARDIAGGGPDGLADSIAPLLR